MEITEGTEGDRFWRGDAVEVLSASPTGSRRRAGSPGPDAAAAATSSTSPRPAAGAQGRGGPRAAPRLAGLELDVVVEPVPGDEDGPALADPPALRPAPRRRAGHAQAPLPRRRRDRRLPDRGDGAATVVPRCAGGLRGGRGTASGRSTQARRGPGRRPCSTMLAPRPGESALDLYAGVGLFARFLPTPSARGPRGGGRGRPRGRPARRRQLPARRGRDAAPSTGCWRRRTTSRSTWWCSTRRATGAKRAVVEQVVARRRARSRTSPATRRTRPRRRDLRRARLPAGGAAGLRPVPDDPPRGVRRPAVTRQVGLPVLRMRILATSGGFLPDGPRPLPMAARTADRARDPPRGRPRPAPVLLLRHGPGRLAQRHRGLLPRVRGLGRAGLPPRAVHAPQRPGHPRAPAGPGRDLGRGRLGGQPARRVAHCTVSTRCCASAGRPAWSSAASRPARSAGTSAARPTASVATCSPRRPGSVCCPTATASTTTARSSAGRSCTGWWGTDAADLARHRRRSGVVYDGTEIAEVVADRPGVAAYVVERQDDGTVTETRLDPRLLPDSQAG